MFFAVSFDVWIARGIDIRVAREIVIRIVGRCWSVRFVI